MPRYFVHMAYDGGPFHGWARQPNSETVQETVEQAISTIYRKKIEVLGCGRTDTGVHASSFYFHVDLDSVIPNFIFRLNSLLPPAITFYNIQEVHDEAHARFDATKRSYRYLAHGNKSPFLNQYSSRIIELKKINLEQLNQVAQLLTEYTEFLPFCKAHADSKTMTCALSQCIWTYKEESDQFLLDVTSDRFLRGMIRLIVGSCVLVATNSISLEDVKASMENQTRLPKNWSAPPEGLFLSDVQYPYINNQSND